MRITQIHQHIPFPESKDGAANHYISFQTGERKIPQGIRKEGVHPRGFSSAWASRDQISAWLVIWGSPSHKSAPRVVLLSSLDPLSENKISQALPALLWRLAELAVQLVLIELVLKQLMEWQLFSLNGQSYCILMENVIIGWTCFTENTFLSLLLLFSLAANCK